MRHSVRKISTAVRAMSETSVFIEEIAVSNTPPRLAALTRVLEAQGSRPVAPTERQGLHPLLIPLAQTTSADSGEQTVTCLLRWPQPNLHKQMPMPVVTMVRNAQTVNLVARSVDEQLHRLLAEEDSRQQQAGPGPRSVAEAAGSDGEALYRPGDAEAAGFGAAGKLNLYLIRKVGMFPDVCEQLCFGHLSRNDTTSALVASEWYMRNGHFPGWARPYEFASEIFQRLEKRSEEARDMARVALRMPWWTLRGAFKEVQHVSCLNGSPEDVKYLLSEEAAAKASAQVTGMHHKEPRTPQEVALERATTLLDLVAAGARPSYDSVRDELSASYRSAGLTDVANFINAA